MLQQETPVKYIQDMTILDINPEEPFAFDSWDDADQFLLGYQASETVMRWLVGKAASELPKEEGSRNFKSWCHRAKLNPGRVAIWRRMWELYDFKNEVQKFPEL